VDARNETGVANGSTLRPFPTIQAGVNAAASGQSVLVATGAYMGDIRVEGKAIQLLGGFAGGSAIQYANSQPGDFTNREPVTTPTTLQGTGAEAVVTLIDAGASVVDGFIISGGGGSTADLPYSSNGGGVFVRNGAPTIRNNRIEGNDPRRMDGVSAFGGGIFSDDADITIEGNEISENAALRGAGVAAFGGTVIIRDNTVRGNIGHDDHGGGLYVGSPDTTITRNRIYENEIGKTVGYGWGAGIIIFNPGNHADLSYNEIFSNFAPGHGAAIFVDEGATADLNHELIYRNEVNPGQTGGGAVYVDGGEFGGVQMGSVVTITNCTIADNPVPDAYVGGNALYVEGGSTVTVRNSVLWGNDLEVWSDDTSSIAITYSNIMGGFSGTGNIAQDPRFADADSGDYHLMSTAGRWDAARNGGVGEFVMDAIHSPCIDTGAPQDTFENEPLPNGGRINMGVYGNTDEASLSDGSVIGEGEGEGEGENGCMPTKGSATKERRADGDILILAAMVLAGAGWKRSRRL